jgi:hypothetical protein
MSQQSMRQAAQRSALDAQATRRRQRVDRERRLEDLVVAVLTALGDRNRAVRDDKRRAGEALRVMADGEGLSVRKAADSAAPASQCGNSPGCAVCRTSLRSAVRCGPHVDSSSGSMSRPLICDLPSCCGGVTPMTRGSPRLNVKHPISWPTLTVGLPSHGKQRKHHSGDGRAAGCDAFRCLSNVRLATTPVDWHHRAELSGDRCRRFS